MCIVGMPERNILTITYRECIVRWVTGDEKFQKLLSSIDTYFDIIYLEVWVCQEANRLHYAIFWPPLQFFNS